MGKYSKVLAESVKRHGISGNVPHLLECWRSLIEDCEDGYSWDVSEYNSEIRVRSELESLLKDVVLQPFKEHDEFRGEVNALDSRFRALFHPSYQLADKGTWWQRGVLAAAGLAHVEFFSSAHGFELTIKE